MNMPNGINRQLVRIRLYRYAFDFPEADGRAFPLESRSL